MRLGLLPASGAASRFRGLPKFLLPISNHESLIERHLRLLSDSCDEVLVATSPLWIESLKLIAAKYGATVIELRTNSMPETVKEATRGTSASEVLVGLPDTYISSENVYARLGADDTENLVLATFRTKHHQFGQLGSIRADGDGIVREHSDKSKDFGHHWGAMRIPAEALDQIRCGWSSLGELIDTYILAKKREVIAREIRGEYFDIASFEKYLDLLTYLQSSRSATSYESDL